MESINLSAYYDKISSIRTKILSKHRDDPAEAVQKYFNDYPSTHDGVYNSYKNR